MRQADSSGLWKPNFSSCKFTEFFHSRNLKSGKVFFYKDFDICKMKWSRCHYYHTANCRHDVFMCFSVGRAGSMRAVTPGGGKIPQLNMSMVSHL